MAKSLNKSRMLLSRLVVVFVFLLVFFTSSSIAYEDALHETFDFIGYGLIAVCALGRLYSTAFLGGFKNRNLITVGPYSVTRNPLYVFSFLGMTGVALVSGHITLMVATPVAFLIMYHRLIGREEAHLLGIFGDEYAAYQARVPKFWPSFKNYQNPETFTMTPHFLNKAFSDAIWWFAAIPLLELAEHLQETGIITPLFMLP